jgi:hypothetical protein
MTEKEILRNFGINLCWEKIAEKDSLFEAFF